MEILEANQKLYDLISDKDRESIDKFNNTTKEYSKNICLHQLIEEQVEKTPDKIALIYNDKQLTYSQLNQKANQLANYIVSRGIKPGTLIAVSVERSLEMVISLLAIVKAGAAYVPVDPELPKERLKYLLQDINSPLLLTQQKFLTVLPEVNSYSKNEVLLLDNEWNKVENNSSENLNVDINEDNLAYMIYTSGSTGKPKGVMVQHKGIVNRLIWMQEEYKLTGNDRILQKTPFNFDVSVWEFFWAFMYGACLVVAKPGGHKDPSYLVDTIIKNKITIIHFVPSMLQAFVDTQYIDKCESLREVICSGEALPFALQNMFFEKLKCRLHNLYGPTEASVDVTYWECLRNDERKFVPIGKPVANTQIHILNDQLQTVAVGEVGELHIAGIQLAKGYYNRSDLTNEKFIKNPYSNESLLYKTGDLARWLPDGTIEYLGRNDFQVQLRGSRIELGEVESNLLDYADIKQAVVLLKNDNNNQQHLVAYLVLENNNDIDTVKLKEFLVEKIPEIMVPSYFIKMDSFPLTSNGKIDRKIFPGIDFSQKKAEENEKINIPQNEIEHLIYEIWKEVLNLENIDINDNFFDVGGHSLLVIKVHQLLTQKLKTTKQVTVVDMFQYTTIASLANYISQESDEKKSLDKIQDRAKKQREARQRLRKRK